MRTQPNEVISQMSLIPEYFYSFRVNESHHTTKSQMIILPAGKDIVDVVAGEPEPKSDITIFREYRDNFDPEQRFKGDKAYIREEVISTSLKKKQESKINTRTKSTK